MNTRFTSLFAYSPGRNVISPATDVICVGLGSIFFMAPLVLLGNTSILAPGVAVIATLTICVNLPHFLASYRIVYRTKQSIFSHVWASLIVPGFLIAYLTFAVWIAETNILFLGAAILVSALYLAWHYTGQAWGMMATYGFLAGSPFSNRERLLIRSGLRIQLVWHLSWVLQYDADGRASDHPEVNQVYFIMSCVTILAYALTIAGFYLYRRRTGKLPPIRAIIAWLAICFWYGAMARDPEAFFWVQIAHAVQYLSFPSRVELNNYDRTHPEEAGSARSHSIVLLIYFVVLIGLGYAIKFGSEIIGVAIIGELFGSVSGAKFPLAVLAFINIHHYFTDGCIWKISNKEVKRELFAHLPRQGRETLSR